ncbi:MAG: phosphoribosylglycinamide formyltransferase [Porticoccaceae bacterium]|nr:MAG: phosphoribosylglycinamide formyltransferase [Porticoccaceae bacterium]
MSASPRRLVILISGRGSNMQALAEACRAGRIPAQVAAVVSNRPDVEGLHRAAALGIPTAVVDHTAFPSREAFDAALLEEVQNHEPDLVALAGFMRILTAAFVSPLLGRILNIHPSLLPKYPGLDTHRRALEAGDREAGATVHFVTEALDGGPPILRVRVPIHPDDTPESLAARVLAWEHPLYVEAVRLVAAGRVRWTPGGVMFDGAPLPREGLEFTGTPL